EAAARAAVEGGVVDLDDHDVLRRTTRAADREVRVQHAELEGAQEAEKERGQRETGHGQADGLEEGDSRPLLADLAGERGAAAHGRGSACRCGRRPSTADEEDARLVTGVPMLRKPQHAGTRER